MQHSIAITGLAASALGAADAAAAGAMAGLPSAPLDLGSLPTLAGAAIALVLALLQRRRAARAEEKARYFAHHEPLTGLLNRPHFVQALDGALAGRKDPAVALLLMEVEGLRQINDLLGHESGDAAIIHVAQTLESLAGEDALVGRLGGNKFAVAVFQPTRSLARDVSMKIIEAVERPLAQTGHDVGLQVHIGIALGPYDGDDAPRLLKSAGLALDRARLRGGSCHVFYERALEAELERRRELEQQIRDTLASEAFELHFQPLFGPSQDRLTGFEALLRMPDGKGSYVSPATFIPVTEEIGLIVEIGDWVVRRACMLAAHWPDHLSVSVNLSPAQFKSGRVLKTVREALATSDIAASRLELEITEGLVLDDDASVKRELIELKKLGVTIVMDDFGTGYSSLSYLWKFPFDKIKIDRSFMRALGAEDRQVADVLHAIVSLSRSLRMRVTAEGVETKEQAAFLRTLGCDEVQGFYFGRPMPVEQVALTILRDVQRERAAAPVRERAPTMAGA